MCHRSTNRLSDSHHVPEAQLANYQTLGSETKLITHKLSFPSSETNNHISYNPPHQVPVGISCDMMTDHLVAVPIHNLPIVCNHRIGFCLFHLVICSDNKAPSTLQNEIYLPTLQKMLQKSSLQNQDMFFTSSKPILFCGYTGHFQINVFFFLVRIGLIRPYGLNVFTKRNCTE